MANEVIEIEETRMDRSMPVTQADVDDFQRKRALLKKFVESQLVEGIDNDYAKIPGTNKQSLLKPGAEKLEKLFGLGHTFVMVEKDLDRAGNFAMFTYKAKVYSLARPDVVIAECDAVCSSQEKKYKDRSVYEKGVFKGKEETPVCDVLNTLSKMAQKRALVGAVIAACAASDYLSQDIEDEQDQRAHGMNGERQGPAKAAVVVPKAGKATSTDQSKPAPVVVPAAAPRVAPAPVIMPKDDAKPPGRIELGKQLNANARALGVQLPAYVYTMFQKEPKDLTTAEMNEVAIQMGRDLEEGGK